MPFRYGKYDRSLYNYNSGTSRSASACYRITSKRCPYFNRITSYNVCYTKLLRLQNTVKNGWHCIDIGANLGYVTIPLSHLCGTEGKVIAVEPIKMFVELLKTYIKKYGINNVEILNYALGKSDIEKIIMGTPVIRNNFV